MRVTKAVGLAVVAGFLLASGDAGIAFESPFQKLRRDMREATSNLKRLRVPSNIGRVVKSARAAPEAVPPEAAEAAAKVDPAEAVSAEEEPAVAVPSPRIRPAGEEPQPVTVTMTPGSKGEGKVEAEAGVMAG